MRNLMVSILSLFVMIAATSCAKKELSTENERDYQTDARILAKFVDVNKVTGEYYINENKKNSPLSYILDKERQELYLVSSAAKLKFENDLKELNSQLAVAAQRLDVSQIVYSVFGETWVRDIDRKAPFRIEEGKQKDWEITRSSYAKLTLLYNTEQWQSFNAGNQIYSKIDINLFGSTYYFFEIKCETNASKSGSILGGNNPKTIVMSGTTSMENHLFTWKENTGSSKVFWEFRGKKHDPQESGGQIVTEFYD